VPRGLFITLEGGEGAGKSRQAEALAARLSARGLKVTKTREPGGTELGERLRRLLLDLPAKGEPPVDPLTETLLFAAARAELAATVIAPAIARGEAVVCDRFADSTAAYQGFGRGVDLALIDELNAVATAGVTPDLVVLLDLPVEAGLARSGGARDRFEQEELAFHERVRAGYQQLAARDSDRWLIVDAAQPPEAVTDAIWPRVEALLAR
jgi:dTMP kinase